MEEKEKENENDERQGETSEEDLHMSDRIGISAMMALEAPGVSEESATSNMSKRGGV